MPIRTCFCIPGAMLLLLGATASPTFAAGSSPADPIPFTAAGGTLTLSLSTSTSTWLRTSSQPASSRTHFEIQTTGSLDTVITVYANLADAIADLPFAEDDDSGEGLNARIQVAIGFAGPYLVRVRPYSSGGTTTFSSQVVFRDPIRCDWPAGCPLAELASAGDSLEFLPTLRDVRDEILEKSTQGRELSNLYWSIAPDLLIPAAIDHEFRQQVYRETIALLPLANAALQIFRGSKEQMQDRRLTQAEVTRLRQLKDLVASKLSSDRRRELEDAWTTIDLDGKQGMSLLSVLQETGFLTREVTSRIVFKLRREPTFDGSRQKLGSSEIDSLVEGLESAKLSRVFFDLETNRSAGLSRVFRLESGSSEDLIERIRTLEDVEWAEPDGKLYVSVNTADPYASSLWGLDMVGATAAWARTYGSCSVPVAVVDTGLRADLLDFAGRVLTSKGYDFADDDADPVDRHGHGTHVAGTIAAAINNSASVVGVAPGVCIFGIKVLSDSGSGNASDIAAGIVHAANQGAKIINLSLGGDGFWQVVEDALAYAASKDVVIVAASGNDGRDGLSYPASSPYAVAVGALDSTRSRASFSNFGEGLDLVAPGVDIVSTFKDGESCMGSGTSMASPHVAGVAALVRTAYPVMNRNGVVDRLRSTAQDLGSLGWDSQFGHGLVDANEALGQSLGCTNAHCFLGQRFVVRMTWRDFQGNAGAANLAPLHSESSGLFWFFDPANWEVLVKVLDGCTLNGHFWVFAAATTNVEYTLEVIDTRNGTTKRYTNPLGVAASAITDTTAFPTCSNSSMADDTDPTPTLVAELTRPASEIGPNENAGKGASNEFEFLEGAPAAVCDPSREICLNSNRFKVEVRWRDFRNQTGTGRSVAGGTSSDSALLWFFDGANWEMLVKVLDGCPLNGRRWVFAAATTNVEYTLRVTDTVTGAVKEYFNPLGRSSPAIVDTSAFGPCSP